MMKLVYLEVHVLKNLRSCHLQKWSNKWSCFVNVESPDESEDGDHITVCFKASGKKLQEQVQVSYMYLWGEAYDLLAVSTHYLFELHNINL